MERGGRVAGERREARERGTYGEEIKKGLERGERDRREGGKEDPRRG